MTNNDDFSFFKDRKIPSKSYYYRKKSFENQETNETEYLPNLFQTTYPRKSSQIIEKNDTLEKRNTLREKYMEFGSYMPNEWITLNKDLDEEDDNSKLTMDTKTKSKTIDDYESNIEFERAPPLRSLFDCEINNPRPTEESEMKTEADDVELENNKKDNWVVVFGYSPDIKSDVLLHFQEIGKIDYITDTNENYIHINFNTQEILQKAIKENGKTIKKNKIGVFRENPGAEESIIPFSRMVLKPSSFGTRPGISLQPLNPYRSDPNKKQCWKLFLSLLFDRFNKDDNYRKDK